MRIAFVCTGNTCRSPMAEVMAKEFFNQLNLNIEVFSRGVQVYFPSGANENAVKAMESRGLDLSMHLARPISVKDLEKLDLVLTMAESHKKVLNSLCSDSGIDVFTLKEFVEADGCDIVDPFGQDVEFYNNCADEIGICIGKLPSVIKNKGYL